LTYFPTEAVATLLKGAALGGTGTPTDDPPLLNRFATLVERAWPRLMLRERRWLETYWPEAIPGQAVRPQAMPPERLEELMQSWPGQRVFESNQMIY
jgi:hypothetical protein